MNHPTSVPFDRRLLLRSGIGLAVTAVTAACSSTGTPGSTTATNGQSSGAGSSGAARPAATGTGAAASGVISPSTSPLSTRLSTPPATGSKPLLVYFSRAGENYWFGDRRTLQVGNTEVLARAIADLIDCDMYRIEAADPYPDAYAPTVTRNSSEQDTDARPAIANPLRGIEQYDTVLIGSPIWGSRSPMIMSTFVESHDFTGKTILPFTTHAVSGLAGAPADYRAAAPTATIGEGLTVQGERVLEQARPRAEQWLADRGLLR